MWLWILLFSLIGSVGAVVGAGLVLWLPAELRRRLTPNLVGYATGTLLGAAFLCMLPASLEASDPGSVSATVLVGIVLFFILEKLALWRHCHDSECAVHSRAGLLILVGDALHNFVDGIVIATAFVASWELGIATALAVVAHEAPQEIGDFAILLDSGYRKTQALWWNILSSIATVPGALMGYLWLSEASELVPHILALSAASFVYVAMADLIPQLHQEAGPLRSLGQLALLMAGIATIALLRAAG